uniref:Uncharacterized protein n=1 Tax=Anguilla anguilla TaxID=7936 RepID=A0A0E9WVK6_ANGAN
MAVVILFLYKVIKVGKHCFSMVQDGCGFCQCTFHLRLAFSLCVLSQSVIGLSLL